jgi:hypothetical protein
MQIKATLRPGQNGTKRYAAQYGDQLICVRYRYDQQRRKRITTVELAVDEKDWLPGVLIAKDQLIFVHVGYGETELRERIKEAGGFWDREKKLWRLAFSKAAQLGLEKRIVDGEFDF